MPLLRPSNSDFLAFVKAAATSPAGGAVRSAASVGAPLVIGRGAAVRASYAGTKSSPGSTVLQLSGPVGGGTTVVPFVDVWLNALAVVTSLAGSSTGSTDGTGSGASFNVPTGVGVLPNGNIVVADQNNHLIRLVTPAGVVTTLAGSIGGGFVNATGTAAQFRNPTTIAVLPSGNIALTDLNNHAIRLITMPSGVVSTIAGSGGPGFANDTGTAASFNTPYGIAVLPNGNLVVADTQNNRIRLITMPGGVVSTIAGQAGAGFLDATGSAAQFNFPIGVTALPNGNIIVVDKGNQRIRLITMPDGVVTTLAGDGRNTFANGTGTAASFNGPTGAAVLPNGNIIVADEGNQRVRLITMPGGVVTTLAGSGGASFANGTGTGASFNNPFGLAVFPNGVIVVGDLGNQRIRLITPT